MTAAFVQGTEAHDTGGGSHSTFPATYTGNVTAGDLLIAAGGWANRTVTGFAVTDNIGDSVPWNIPVGAQALQGTNSPYAIALAWKVAGLTTSSPPTVTFTPGGAPANFVHLKIAEYSGVDTLDQATSGTSANTSGTTATSSAFTTTQAAELIYAWPIFDQGSTPAAGSGFTLRDSGGSQITEEKIVSTIQTGVTATATNPISGLWAIAVATFYKASGGAAPAYPPPNRFSSARSKISALRRGRATNPTLTQAPPVPPAMPPPRMLTRRTAAGLARGKRWNSATMSGLAPVSPPVIYSPLSTAARQFRRVGGTRGKRTSVVPAQVPVPIMVVPNRAPAGRRIAALRRGRQVSAAILTPQAVVVVAWPPSRVGRARSVLGSATRSRRTVLPAAHHIVPVRSSRTARLVVVRRGRLVLPVPAQVIVLPPAWTPPKVGAPRRLLSGAQRGRRSFPTPAQIPVPLPVWPNRSPAGRRLAALYRSRLIPPAWIIGTAPSAPILLAGIVLPSGWLAGQVLPAPIVRPSVSSQTAGVTFGGSYFGELAFGGAAMQTTTQTGPRGIPGTVSPVDSE